MNTSMYQPLTKTLCLQASALTDRGQQREVNEDAIFQFTEYTQEGENIGLYIVCDGMGGLEAGDVASQLAVQTIVAALGDLLVFDDPDANPALVPQRTPQTFTRWLRDTIVAANGKIRDIIHEGSVRRMGTTVNAVLIHNDQAYIANVGDSRTFLWRKGELTLLTSDHTMVNELIKENVITPEEARTSRMRNILTHAVGGKETLETIDLFQRTLQAGDRLLLCSDGLWQAYPDLGELAKRIAQSKEPGDLCWKLVAEANERDGSDNISTVAVYIHSPSNYCL